MCVLVHYTVCVQVGMASGIFIYSSPSDFLTQILLFYFFLFIFIYNFLIGSLRISLHASQFYTQSPHVCP